MPGFDLREEQDIFLYSTVSTLALEPTKPPVYSFTKGNWLGHETDRSPSSNAKVKNGGAVYVLPKHVFMVWCLFNQAQGQHRNLCINDHNAKNMYQP
jgi:hypothetical protein